MQTPKGRSEKLQRVDPAWRRRSKVTTSESFAKLCSRRPGETQHKKRTAFPIHSMARALECNYSVYTTWPCPACDTAIVDLCSSFWWTLKWLLIHNTWKYCATLRNASTMEWRYNITQGCIIFPMSTKTWGHPAQLDYSSVTRPSLLREGLACETMQLVLRADCVHGLVQLPTARSLCL